MVFTIFSVLDMMGSLLRLVGAHQLAEGDKLGFWVFIVTDLMLLVPALHSHLYGMCIMFFINALINVRAVWLRRGTREQQEF